MPRRVARTDPPTEVVPTATTIPDADPDADVVDAIPTSRKPTPISWTMRSAPSAT